MNHIERFRSLSAREREVLDLFCQGLSQMVIGERLVISPKTVRAHMAHIYQKLDLMDLTPRARAFTLREDYWPLHKSEPIPANEPETEVEIIEPVPAKVEKMVAEDEGVMRSLVVLPPKEITPPKPKRRGWVWACLGLAIIIPLVLVGVFFAFGGWDFLQGLFLSQISTPDPSEQVVIAQPTSTLQPTTSMAPATTAPSAPAPSSTATSRPQPTADMGPVYEMGEWHKQGDLWFRLYDYSVDWEGIYITVEMWNQTSQPVYFQWSTNRSMSLRDNQGNRYTVDSRFHGNEDNEIVPANTRLVIGSDPYINWTNWYDPDHLFKPGVSELYLTLEDFSVVEKATWRISLGD